MNEPMIWTPTLKPTGPNAPMLTLQIGASPKPPRLAESENATRLIWMGEDVQALRSIRVVADAHAARTSFVVELMNTPKLQPPEGLIEALQHVGVKVELVNVDDGNVLIDSGAFDPSAAGAVPVNVVSKTLDDFVTQTGVMPTHLYVSADVGGLVARMASDAGCGGDGRELLGVDVVVVEGNPGAPAGYAYAARAGLMRAGEAVRVVVPEDGQTVQLEASAPHPSGVWRPIRSAPNTLEIPPGEHPASIVAGGVAVAGRVVDVPGFAA